MVTKQGKLLRGIQKIERTNKDGSKVTKYRVQMKTKSFKTDKLFDEYEEAKEFLLTTKTRVGRNHIDFVLREARSKFDFVEDIAKQPPFRDYTEMYRARYIRPKFNQWLGLNEKEMTAEAKFKLRQFKAEESFFRTINNTRIRPYDESKVSTITNASGVEEKWSQALSRPRGEYQYFGLLKPQNITGFEINEYINERLRSVRPGSVESELTKISNVFKKLKYIDPSLANLPNPVLQADRDLLKAHKQNLPPTRSIKRLGEEDKRELFEALNKRENKDLFNGIKFMLMTGLRRSEMVLLLRSNCFSSYIHIHNNKSNRPRTVYLIPEAQELLQEELARKNPEGRVFNFLSVSSFASQFKKCMKKHGLEHIKPHLMRKEFISSMVEKLGRQNSLVLATILGNDVRALEEAICKLPIEQPINDQRELLAQVGHRDPRVTQEHYLELNLKN